MFSSRLLLFCGKGGVGKTTLSSAVALTVAREGRRVLLISTDPAHSLSDVFERPVGREPVEIERNLHACELDTSLELREYVEEVISTLKETVNPEVLGRFESLLRSAGSAPGAEEAVLLDSLSRRIPRLLEEFDCLILDTAPTGHTLRLLREAIRSGEWLEELLKRREKIYRLRSAAEGVRKEDRVIEVLRGRRNRLSRLLRILSAKETLFVPVLVPERLPLLETSRLVEEIESMGFRIGALIVNKVLPAQVRDTFLKLRKEQEERYLEEVRRRFSRYRLLRVSLRARDVSGAEELLELARDLREF
ncbi:MAG TPA: hypothetical protein ENJ61_02215 [Aquifex aeolicus]|uniref:arsenite-transporting ATPase n=1 Tax=Aquifex aeolicus TaxID=63363 RepID=A0A7C5Q7K0_AQUAO|nr:hypothetical protein [Aquifex aeolicus]